MARELKLAERRRDATETRVRAMQDDIKNRLREKGVRKVPGVVNVVDGKRPQRLRQQGDASRRRLQPASISQQFATQGEPGDRLVITRRVSDP